MLNKNVNFNKNEAKSIMENPAHSFREINLVPQLIQESQIESKTVMSWSLQKEKEYIFCIVYFVRKKFFKHLNFISMYSVLNTLSEYFYIHTYFCISKNITSCTFLFVFNVVESLQCILNKPEFLNKAFT